MDIQNFTNMALRTESRVSSASLDRETLINLLKMYITIGTLLDYTKKGIFYNNYSKYDDNYINLMNQLNDQLAETLANNSRAKDRSEENQINFRVIHGLLGAITESSELAEHLLQYLTDGKVDVVGIGEEFGDSMWYYSVLSDELKLDLNKSMSAVIDKLRIRFPDKYSNEDAANRNLDAERDKLNNITRS